MEPGRWWSTPESPGPPGPVSAPELPDRPSFGNVPGLGEWPGWEPLPASLAVALDSVVSRDPSWFDGGGAGLVTGAGVGVGVGTGIPRIRQSAAMARSTSAVSGPRDDARSRSRLASYLSRRCRALPFDGASAGRATVEITSR